MSPIKPFSILILAGVLALPARLSAAETEISLDGLRGRDAAAKISAASPGTVFVRKGVSVTREQLIDEARKMNAEAAAAAKSSAASGEDALRKATAEFEQKQKAELAATNARLKAQFEAEKAKLASRQMSEKRKDEIRTEATLLLQKAQTANPKEKEQIDRRAAELLKEVAGQKQ
ncbi:MAG TPA: hypothetical protein VFS34_04105 [Thermoanaerobaculia bacterium]|nr:hypothetical protein [Thermoanaerobaculia bacterium]